LKRDRSLVHHLHKRDVATADSVTKADTTTAAMIIMARLKRSEIQTHCFST